MLPVFGFVPSRQKNDYYYTSVSGRKFTVLTLSMRQSWCFVEMHYESVLKKLSVLLLAITRLLRNWIKLRPTKQSHGAIRQKSYPVLSACSNLIRLFTVPRSPIFPQDRQERAPQATILTESSLKMKTSSTYGTRLL